MTLQEVIKAIEMIASQQPSVNMVVQNDIFRLNSLSNARYGVFGWTQGQHSTSTDSSMFTFSFTFFYNDINIRFYSFGYGLTIFKYKAWSITHFRKTYHITENRVRGNG